MARLIHQWKNLSLVETEITLPNKKQVLHTTIQHPGAAVILPIFDNGEILLLKQYRPSINDWLYEFPAGTVEKDESPLQCAHRELEEETGYSAGSFKALGDLIPLAGFCNERQTLYVATQLQKTSRYACDDDEVIEVLSLSVKQLENMIVEGYIIDSKTIACLSKAKLCGYI
ncbi:NUDIX hydrolase [Vibrio sp. MA40-2]|uniref:NUDIX hydrolase n=1 Tax=Vibrio sp. MA40-2 TaxID=3391828 RepID=UPI0039A70D57